MQFDKLFRKSLFGGFNKSDVEAYVKTLEDELEKVRESKAASADEKDKEMIAESLNEISKLKAEKEDMMNQINLLEAQLKNQAATKDETAFESDAEEYLKLVQENAVLKDELQKMQNDQQQYQDDKDLIGRILRDAKAKAELMLKEADTECERKIQCTDRAIEEKKEQVYNELEKELERRVVDFITVKYRLVDYINGIEAVREQLAGLVGSLQLISQGMPTSVLDLMEEIKKEDLVDTKCVEVDDETTKEKAEEEKQIDSFTEEPVKE